MFERKHFVVYTLVMIGTFTPSIVLVNLFKVLDNNSEFIEEILRRMITFCITCLFVSSVASTVLIFSLYSMAIVHFAIRSATTQ
jgi:hypothetical protein